MAYKLALEFDPAVSSVVIGDEHYVSTKQGRHIVFVRAKESMKRLLSNAMKREVDDFGVLVEETEVQLQSLKDAIRVGTACKYFVKVKTEDGARTLSVFSAAGLAALPFNAELAYAAASSKGLVIEGLYLHREGEPVKMVEVQDLVLFPERTVQNETMEALLDWICSMASPDDPVEWRAKFIEAYGAKVKYIASKQAVPSTINFDGKERINPFLEMVLAWEDTAKQEAMILREVVALSSGEEDEAAAPAPKRKRGDGSAGRGRGRAATGRGRGRGRGSKTAKDGAAATQPSATPPSAIPAVLSATRMREVLTAATTVVNEKPGSSQVAKENNTSGGDA